MIVVRTKAGEVWNLGGLDALTVVTASGALARFQVGDIADITIDTGGSQLDLLDGSGKRAGGETDEIRALQVVDGETGVAVRVVFALDLARTVGEKLAEGKIIVARSLPKT